MAAAAKRLDAIDQPKPLSINVAKPDSEVPLDVALRKINETTGKGYFEIMQEFIGLAFGPGRISFRDYLRLRLFDDKFYDGVAKKSVIGQRRNRDISVAVNYRIDWYGLLENKVASISYLGAYGLPVIPYAAIYSEILDFKSPIVARNRKELRDLLTDESQYPLFGKPTEAFQSLGSIALTRYIASEDKIERTDGVAIPLDEFLNDISSHYSNGYLFQKLVYPHRTIRALCGDRLATARIATIATEAGPKVFRACLKIPAGSNSADNYWRPGNLLAQVDLTEGRITRVTTGAGIDLTEITHHPDSGKELIGAIIPNWNAMLAATLAGARLMQHVPMIGWDIASVDAGAVIVEMNEAPDFFLHQLADRRGALEPEFQAFIDFQERNAKEHERRMRKNINKL
jgi:Sugar-transfer associated ATP-grasp